MKELVINSSVQHTLLLFIPLLFAYVLKVAKLRSWSLIGGALGGIMLGPAVLGSVAPEYWEGLFQGGTAEHAQYEQLANQQRIDMAAATKLGVDENILLQMRADQQYELLEKQVLWDQGQWRDQRTIRDYSMVLIVLILLSGNLRTRAKGTAPPAMSLSVGVWAALIPSGIVTLIAYTLWEAALPSALALGACLAVGPWTFSRWERKVAEESEEGGAAMMLHCGRVAWVVASSIALYASWQVQQAMALVWLLPLLLLPACWLFPTKPARWLRVFVDYGAIPSVMATTLVLIHPIDSLSLWPIIVVILLCADARWLGGIIGLGLIGGRKNIDTMRLSLPLVDAGVSQLCMAALLFGVGVLPPPYTLAAIIGAIFLDRTAVIRMKFAATKNDPRGN